MDDKELYRLIEHRDKFCEMSNFRKKITGLLVNLSLQIETDEEKNYQHNLPRLKFQNNAADRVTSNADLIPVSIDPFNPQVLVDKKYNSIIEILSSLKNTNNPQVQIAPNSPWANKSHQEIRM